MKSTRERELKGKVCVCVCVCGGGGGGGWWIREDLQQIDRLIDRWIIFIYPRTIHQL